MLSPTRVAVQALGCLIAIVVGGVVSSIPCVFLLLVERRRSGSELWLQGKLLHLTPYEQQTGKTGTEFWIAPGDLEEARHRVAAGVQRSADEADFGWIAAATSLAMSEKPNEDLPELFDSLMKVLQTSYQGTAEEQIAVTVLGARADIRSLPVCVDRLSMHRAGLSTAFGERVKPWKNLDPKYVESLIVTISELVESFAGEFEYMKHQVSSEKFAQIEASSVSARKLLKEITEDKTFTAKDEALSVLAGGYFRQLQKRAVRDSRLATPV